MKCFVTLLLSLLVVASAYATPSIGTSGDTLVITVNAEGDLASSYFTTDQLAATNIKVITANGVTLSTTDVENLLGAGWNAPTVFTKITDLDLSQAVFANSSDISQLHNSNKLNGGNALGTLVLPESLTAFPSGALDNTTCTWTKIVFPNAIDSGNESTVEIASGAFASITSIKSVAIGTCVKSIGANAFTYCSNITSLDFLNGITKIDAQAFSYCTGLTKLVLPESLAEIGTQAFIGCTGLTSVRLPNALQYIRQGAFSDCTGLTKIVIPASVESIEIGAFSLCTSLTDVYVLGTATKCANQAFQPTSMTYGYSYSGAGTGETVTLSDYTKTGNTYTVLHYPEAAYETYVNLYTRLIGTTEYANQTTYSKWNNKWVYDADGNKWPVADYGYFNNYGDDYAGWWNFMLSAKIKSTYKDERLIESKWYSVCFPFDLDATQIGDAFGSATEVCEFSGANIEQDENSKNYLILEFKTPVTTMTAHHPYMIHPGIHNATYNTLVDVTIDTDTDNDNFATKLKAQSVQFTTDGVTYTFIGNHTDGAKVPKYSYYYYSGKATEWANGFYKAMRDDVVFTPHTAVVELDKDNGVSGAKMTYPANNFNSTTAIGTVQIVTPTEKTYAQKVYNIFGQVVRAGSTDLEGLPAGLYIVNGKKYMVR